MLINASSHTHANTPIHMRINTRRQRHACTSFLHLSQLRFDRFHKKKFTFHCMLIIKCNNFNSKQCMSTHLKFDGFKCSITVNNKNTNYITIGAYKV